MLLSLVTIPIMIHGLGLTAYGIYTLAFSIAGLGVYLDFALGWTVSKFVAEADMQGNDGLLASTVRASLVYHALLGLGLVILVTPSAEWIARSLLRMPGHDASDLARVLRLAMISFVCSSIAGVLAAALRGMRRFATATLVWGIGGTISAFGAAAAAWLGLGVLAATAAQLVGAFLGLVLAAWTCQEYLLRSTGALPVWTELRKMLAFSVWNFLNRLTQLCVFWLDRVLVGAFGGPAMLPFYTVPLGLAQKVNFVALPAATTIYPTAAAAQYKSEPFLTQYFSGTRVIHVTTGALALALLSWGDRFLAAWIGPEMATDGTFFLVVFTVGYWLLSVGCFDAGCIEGWSRPNATFMIVAIGLLFGVTLGLVTSSWIGVVRAICLGVGAYLSLAGVGQVIYWQRMSRYSIRRFLRQIALPLVEMATLALCVSLGLRRVVTARLLVIATLPGLAVILALYGIFRAFTGEERRTILSRVASSFLWPAPRLRSGTGPSTAGD